MKKQSKKNKEHRILRRVVPFGAVLLSVGILAFSLYASHAVDEEYDEALFKAAGADTVTRFYFQSDEGIPVEELDGALFTEWESERVSHSAECLYTPYDEIPEHLKNAFVAIEDIRFYRHHGVDILRTGKAVLNSVFHFAPRFGGSTITQQLIKNIGGEKDPTAARKLKEMLRARSLERRHSKAEILEAYLNIVPMSQNRVGVGAGAALYFGKSPDQLTLAECASIAAITRAPAIYAPERDMEKHLSRRDAVLGKMREEGMISEEEYKEALAERIVLSGNTAKKREPLSWYTETVLRDVKRDLMREGYTEAAATALLYRGGLKIYTAVDRSAQRAAEEYFENEKNFAAYGEGFAASLVLLSPENGDLAAIVGGIGRKEGDLLLNYATDTLRAPGSALKPIALYAPAIEEGMITEATVFDDVPSVFPADGSFWPRNADGKFSGLIQSADALARSKNTVAVSLYHKLGAEHIYACLSRLGIDTLVRRATAPDGTRLTDLAPSPLALGELTDGVSLFALTRAYLPLADHGRMHGVRSYFLVQDREGKPLLRREQTTERVYADTTASVMTHMLRRVVEEGSASALTIAETLDTAGKTGTSGNARDRFFIGYTPYYLGGVWCGYADGARAVEGDIHLCAFDAVMREIHSRIPANENSPTFTMAAGLRAVRVCADSGGTPTPLCSLDVRGERTRTVWLKAGDTVAPCTVHTACLYSKERGGVLLSPHPSAKRIALLHIERDLPVDIPIEDAEYTCRPLNGTSPAVGDLPYYASLLPSGHYAGHAPHGGRPFNALAKDAPTPPTEKPQGKAPEKEKRKPPQKRKEDRGPLSELLEKLRKFRF